MNVRGGTQPGGRANRDDVEAAPAAERRWAVLGNDGRHAWLGRHLDPSPAEVSSIEAGLSEQDMAGWIAIVEGDYWNHRSALGVMPVHPIGHGPAPFDEVAARFRAKRQEVLRSIGTHDTGLPVTD